MAKDPASYQTKIDKSDVKLLDRNTIILNKTELEDRIELRITKFGKKIEDLFLMINPNRGSEGEFELHTQWGKLKVFARKNVPGAFLLSRPKFKWPTLVKASSKMFNVIGGQKSNFTKVEKKNSGTTRVN